MKRFNLTVAVACISLFVASCSKTEEHVQSVQEEAVLASSSFYPGKTAPLVKAPLIEGGESGTISGPASGGANDGGSIPAPGSGSTAGGSTGGSTTPSGSGSSSTAPTDPGTSGSVAGSGSTTPPAGSGSTIPGSGSSPGTPGTTPPQPSGNDGGTIAGPQPSGNDGGNLGGGSTTPGSTPGSGSVAGGSSGSTGGVTPTDPTGNNNNGGNTAPGSDASGGTNAGTTPSGGGSTVPTQPGGNDGGSISTNPPSSGNDGGQLGGNTAPGSGSIAGGSTGGSGANSGSTTPIDPNGSNNGGSATPGSGAAGGTIAGNGGSSGSGSVTPPSGSDGGSIPGGSIPPSGSDGGSVPGGNQANNGNNGGSTTPGGSTQPGGSTSPVDPNNNGGSTGGGSSSGNQANNGNNGGSTTPGGSTNPGGNDGGSVPGGNPPPSGNDGGSTPGGGQANNGNNNGGSSGGSTTPGGQANNGNSGGTPTPGGNQANNGNNGGSTTPGGNDGGTLPGNTPPNGNDGGAQPPAKPPTIAELLKDLLDKIKDLINGNSGGSSSGGSQANNGNNGGNNGGGSTGGGSSSGGSHPTPGGSNSNHCNCSTAQKFKINLARVCSAARSQIPYPKFVFFEEAATPIISVEATVNMPSKDVCELKKSVPAQTQYASVGFSSIPQNYKVHTTSSGLMNFVVDAVDLAGVNLFDGKYSTQIQLQLTQMKKALGNKWRDALLYVRVCDDTNHDGRCSDEKTTNILSVASTYFPLDRVPSSVSLDVWNGRFMTLKSDPEICEKQYSPLVLDLTGEGFNLVGPDQGVYFDLNATGEKIATGWTKSPNVAFLVRDLDGNGRIDSGAELFGSATSLSNGKRAMNGFEALKDLDDNGDGKFTSEDRVWNQVKLWVDRNHNGYSEREELFSLRKGQIESVNLDYIDVMEIDPHGNQTRQRSVYRRTVNGKSVPLMIIDIWFSTLVNH